MISLNSINPNPLISKHRRRFFKEEIVLTGDVKMIREDGFTYGVIVPHGAHRELHSADHEFDTIHKYWHINQNGEHENFTFFGIYP